MSLSLSGVQLFVTPWTAARQASLSFTVSRSFRKLKCVELVIPSNHLCLCWLFAFCLKSFPVSGSLPVGQLFASGNQSIGASAAVLPMNIQDWLPLGLTGLISLQSKGLSSLLQHHSSKASSFWLWAFFYDPTHTSIHDYWKNLSLTIRSFISKVISLLYNRFVIAFLLSSRYL